MMRATPDSPRMFDSDFADFFSRTPWWTVLLIWIPIVLGFLAYAAFGIHIHWPILILQMFAGLTTWTLTEYWLHRTVFHWEPDNAIGKRFHFIIHGCHHTWIDDKYRLVMPPIVSLTLAALFYQGFCWTAVLLEPWLDPTWVYAFNGAFLAGYINYDITHYATHHVKLKNKRLIRIRAHHMNHHHNNPDKKFGFTTFIWDQVFGTR
jgi:sterol desaturase/sphingolipid hydroxylase (fatty acid hydroxylase superfamily)